MANEELKNLSKEELIERIEKLEDELKQARCVTEYYSGEVTKLKAKLEIIANTLKL